MQQQKVMLPSANEIRRQATVDNIEQLLHLYGHIRHQTDAAPAELKLAAHQSKDIFADIWSAIAVGTYCSRTDSNAVVKMWGIRQIGSDFEKSRFVNSLPGIVAIQMASSVISDGSGEILNRNHLEQIISNHQKGVLEQAGGSTRTLCEFDPQQPVAPLLFHNGARDNIADRRRLFRRMILQFRSDLEIGGLNRGIRPLDVGSIRHLTTFLSEIHDNAFEHGRVDPSNMRKIRLLRLRKHVSTSKNDLVRRARAIPLLSTYLQNITRSERTQAILEASVTDFGLGIVDHFLNSQYGKEFGTLSRITLLQDILSKRN